MEIQWRSSPQTIPILLLPLPDTILVSRVTLPFNAVGLLATSLILNSKFQLSCEELYRICAVIKTKLRSRAGRWSTAWKAWITQGWISLRQGLTWKQSTL